MIFASVLLLYTVMVKPANGRGRGKKLTQLELEQNISIKLICDSHSKESVLCVIVRGFGGLTNKEQNSA